MVFPSALKLRARTCPVVQAHDHRRQCRRTGRSIPASGSGRGQPAMSTFSMHPRSQDGAGACGFVSGYSVGHSRPCQAFSAAMQCPLQRSTRRASSYSLAPLATGSSFVVQLGLRNTNGSRLAFRPTPLSASGTAAASMQGAGVVTSASQAGPISDATSGEAASIGEELKGPPSPPTPPTPPKAPTPPQAPTPPKAPAMSRPSPPQAQTSAPRSPVSRPPQRPRDSFGEDRRGPPSSTREGRVGQRPPPRAIPPGAVTYTECGKCGASYKIQPEDLGTGRKVRCAVCSNTWFQKPDQLMWLKDGYQFEDYPLEEKDERMQARERSRSERAARSRSYRDDRARAPGGRDEGARRFSNGRGGRSSEGRNYGSNHSIYIGNLPYSVAEDELRGLVSAAAEVVRVTVVKDPSGRSKGFAFADVKTEEDVEKVIAALDGQDVSGRRITARPGRK